MIIILIHSYFVWRSWLMLHYVFVLFSDENRSFFFEILAKSKKIYFRFRYIYIYIYIKKKRFITKNIIILSTFKLLADDQHDRVLLCSLLYFALLCSLLVSRCCVLIVVLLCTTRYCTPVLSVLSTLLYFPLLSILLRVRTLHDLRVRNL